MSQVVDLKKVLKTQLELDSQFLELVKELCEEVFGKNSSAFYTVMDYYNYYENYGCLPSLMSLKNQAEENKKRAEEYKSKQEREQIK